MYVFLFIRVFLRAINTYADTMNQKFLNNDDFEVQVIVLVCNYSLQFVTNWQCLCAFPVLISTWISVVFLIIPHLFFF